MKTNKRLPFLTPEECEPDQRKLYDSIAANMGGGAVMPHIWMLEEKQLNGPFNAMVHYPDIGTDFYALQRTILRQGGISRAASELLVLATVSHAGAAYGIYAHIKLGLAAGLTQEQIDAILAGKRPPNLSEEESVVYDLTSAILAGGPVPEEVYQRAKGFLGEKGYMAVSAKVALFQFIGTILNAYDEPAPE
ncbi:MAG: carboxymuconolactone decarboxylase family protein [Treponema sp.]|jgi:alkylhydroperoxidase/carboxymuconolactone decarboxylase family protein YurZ|nr:carboxymuconolactone decarboxylase family protein [Treponema sp.]